MQLTIYRLVLALGQIWGWIGFGYYWNAHNKAIQITMAFLAVMSGIAATALQLAIEGKLKDKDA